VDKPSAVAIHWWKQQLTAATVDKIRKLAFDAATPQRIPAVHIYSFGRIFVYPRCTHFLIEVKFKCRRQLPVSLGNGTRIVAL
jgi:hypothetical protein